jgi:UTP-glucose-1-phosphate uridylyltransferase
MPDAVLVAASLMPSDYYVIVMPDTYIDESPIQRLVEAEAISGSDIVAASWEMTENLIGRVGQIASKNNQITNIVDKDSTCRLSRFWGMLLLNKSALHFIHNTDAHLGQALMRAINSGTAIAEVQMPGKYYDVCDLASYTDLLLDTQSNKSR